MQTKKLGRREVLQSGAAGVAALTLATIPAVANPGARTEDAELVELGTQLQRLWDIERPLWAAYSATEDEAYCKRGAEVQEAIWPIVDRITALSAVTLAGLKAKALALNWITYGEPPGDPDQDLALSIARDIEAIAYEVRS
jgi:hypothetical protein